MRTIRKRVAPNSLTQWRAPRLAANRGEGLECTYAAMRSMPAVLKAVEDNLFEEQGGICAYTGQRIRLTPANAAAEVERTVDFHIEHMIPQALCTYGQDADYSNLVACWPCPNCGFEPTYGAKRKGSWPSPAEQALFVSPLRADCSARFKFNDLGKISAAREDDAAANRTIDRLGLHDSTLADLRRQAIRGALNPSSGPIRLNEARKLLRVMERDSDDVNHGVFRQLRPFCFAIQPALERKIRMLEAIRNQA